MKMTSLKFVEFGQNRIVFQSDDLLLVVFLLGQVLF